MIDNIIFDLDGTLTTKDTGLIPPSTVDAISQLKKLKKRVILATGRPFFEIPKGFLDVIKADYYVLFNGKLVLDRYQQVLFEQPIDPKMVSIIHQEIIKRGWDYGFHLSDYTLILKGESIQRAIKEVTKQQNLIKLGKVLPPNTPVYNIMVRISDDQELATIRAQYPQLKFEWFHQDFYDIYDAKIDKSVGLEFIFTRLHTSWASTLVFGDGVNDVTMLTKAQYGVRMADGHETLKAIKGLRVSPSSRDDGIFKTLMKFSLVEDLKKKHSWSRFKKMFFNTSMRYTLPISGFLLLAFIYDIIINQVGTQSYTYLGLSLALLIYSGTFYFQKR